MKRKVNQSADQVRRIQAEAFLLAARIAQKEASSLAPEYWNQACRAIAQRLEAASARLEMACDDDDRDSICEAETVSILPALN